MEIKISPKIKILLIVLLLISGVSFVIFAVFINRGSIELSGAVPFTVEISGWKSQNCFESPCQLILAPGKYNLKISRENSAIIHKTFQVDLQKTTSESLFFEAEPFIQPLGISELYTISNSFPRIDLNFQNIRLTELTNASLNQIATFYRSKMVMKNIIFSPDSQHSLYDDGEKFYLINSENPTNLIKLSQIPSGSFPIFSPDSTKIFYLAKETPTKNQGLYFLELNESIQNNYSATPEISDTAPGLTQTGIALVYFPRTFQNYQLKISTDLKHLAILDLTNSETQSIYLVDLEKISREKIISDTKISGISFLTIDQNLLLIEQPGPNPLYPQFSIFNIKTSQNTPIQIFSRLGNIDQSQSGSIIYASSAESELSPINSGFSIEQYNLETNSRRVLYKINDLDFPTVLNSEENNSKIYFQIKDNIYRLNLK